MLDCGKHSTTHYSPLTTHHSPKKTSHESLNEARDVAARYEPGQFAVVVESCFGRGIRGRNLPLTFSESVRAPMLVGRSIGPFLPANGAPFAAGHVEIE